MAVRWAPRGRVAVTSQPCPPGPAVQRRSCRHDRRHPQHPTVRTIGRHLPRPVGGCVRLSPVTADARIRLCRHPRPHFPAAHDSWSRRWRQVTCA